MAKKDKRIDAASLQSLKDMVKEFSSEIEYFDKELRDDSCTWQDMRRRARRISTWGKAIRNSWPVDIEKKPASTLAEHAFFVQKYCVEENYDFVDSNLTSLRADLRKINEELSRAEPLASATIECFLEEIKSLSDKGARDYLEESCKCISADAYRASIVMSGCALESKVRDIFRMTRKKDPSKIHFANLIDSLVEDSSLSSDQSALVNTCRTFRNLTGHPSGFNSTRGDAEGLFRLAIEQLKKCQKSH